LVSGSTSAFGARKICQLRVLPSSPLTEFQTGHAVDFLEHQQLTRIDEVGVVNLFEIHSPQLGPAPRAFEEHAGNVPKRIAALDGIGVGRVFGKLGQRHTLGRDLFRRAALGGRDGVRLRHGGRSGQHGQGQRGAVQGCARLPNDGTSDSKGHVQKTPGPSKAIGTQVRRNPRGLRQFRIGWSIQPVKKLPNLALILPANP